MTIGWHFDNTYSKLSNTFKEEVKPTPVHNPELVVLNDQLAQDLKLDFSKEKLNAPSLTNETFSKLRAIPIVVVLPAI